MRRIAGTLLFAFALVTAAQAQELTAGVSKYIPFGINDLDGELPLSAEFRLTVPLL